MFQFRFHRYENRRITVEYVKHRTVTGRWAGDGRPWTRALSYRQVYTVSASVVGSVTSPVTSPSSATLLYLDTDDANSLQQFTPSWRHHHHHSATPITTSCPEKEWSILGITKFFHYGNLQEICNKAIVKYHHHISNAPLHYLVKYWCQKTSVSCALWQSYWKINSPESWRVAGSSCIFKWNLFIITSFTNSLYDCISFR